MVSFLPHVGANGAAFLSRRDFFSSPSWQDYKAQGSPLWEAITLFESHPCRRSEVVTWKLKPGAGSGRGRGKHSRQRELQIQKLQSRKKDCWTWNVSIGESGLRWGLESVTNEFVFLSPDMQEFRPGTLIKAKANLLRPCRGREHWDSVPGSVSGKWGSGCSFSGNTELAGVKGSWCGSASFSFFETLMSWYMSAKRGIQGFWDSPALIIRCRKGHGLALDLKNKLKRSQSSSWTIVLQLPVHNCPSSGSSSLDGAVCSSRAWLHGALYTTCCRGRLTSAMLGLLYPELLAGLKEVVRDYSAKFPDAHY